MYNLINIFKSHFTICMIRVSNIVQSAIYHLEHSLAELVVWAFSIGVCMYVYNLFYTLFELRIIYI